MQTVPRIYNRLTLKLSQIYRKAALHKDLIGVTKTDNQPGTITIVVTTSMLITEIMTIPRVMTRLNDCLSCCAAVRSIIIPLIDHRY